MDKKNKIKNPKQIDKIISAEIPENDETLKKLVLTHMIHGPHNYKKLPCFDEKKQSCKYKYLKSFCSDTKFLSNGFPQYKRRDNRKKRIHSKIKLNGKFLLLDNSMVVPYNAYLLKRYNCHINVEYCSSISSIKYIYKYIHKGLDKAFVKIKTKNEDTIEIKNEINDHVEGRYLSAMEAAWRLLQLPMSGRSHAVIQLDIHTENQQRIVFEENKENDALEKNHDTTLTAWFKLNQIDPEANNIKYINIPKYYTYDRQSKIWKKKKSQ